MMWSSQDIRGLMLISGFTGVMIGTMGVALYLSVSKLKEARSKNKGSLGSSFRRINIARKH